MAASTSSLSSVVSKLMRASMGASVPSDLKDEDLDRHVAELIMKEAKQSEERYKGKEGIRAYLHSGQPEANIPKTNKRFLHSIIRNVDDHNSAIIQAQAKAAEELRLQREDAEKADRRARAVEASQERLRRLMGGGRRRSRERDESAGSSSSRHASSSHRHSSSTHTRDWRRADDDTEFDEHSSYQSRDRRRDFGDDGEPRSSRARDSPRRTSPARSESPSGSRAPRESSHRSRHQHSSRHPASHGRSKSPVPLRSHSRDSPTLVSGQNHSTAEGSTMTESSPQPSKHARRPRSRSRSRSPCDTSHESKRHRHRREKRRRSESPSRSRSTSPSRSKRHSKSHRSSRHHDSKRPKSERHSDVKGKARRGENSLSDDESGPTLPSSTTGHSSKMDKYFDPAYDPLLDYQPVLDTNSLVEDGAFDGWNAMLQLVRIRREDREEKKRREKEGSASGSSKKTGLAEGRSDPDFMDIVYKKRGAIREWDLGKD